MLLSDTSIRAALDSKRLVLDPCDRGLVQPASIDVRLDRYFRVFNQHSATHIDPSVEQPDLTRAVRSEERRVGKECRL